MKTEPRETGMDGSTYAEQEVHRSKNNRFIAHVVDDRFQAPCGPLHLGEAIHELRPWATSRHRGAR
ncbi:MULTISPECIES: Imm53 family immunity protein [Catenuloplanes]|nr:Imm53 family immunity protein [Catenuloplanes niger]